MHAPQSAPIGVLGLCPACGGETSIRLIVPTNAPRVERRTFECKACHERQAFVVARVSETTHMTRQLLMRHSWAVPDASRRNRTAQRRAPGS